jgi:hypothetical protein
MPDDGSVHDGGTCVHYLRDNLVHRYTRIGVIAYASVVGCLVVGVLIFLACVHQIEKRHGTDSARCVSCFLNGQ